MQVMYGALSGFKRIATIPLILGVLSSTKFSPFSLACFAILYISYTKKRFFYILNYVNIIIMVLCLMEYIFLFIMDTQLIKKDQYMQSTLTILYKQLEINPLSALSYIFIYTSGIKAFYMVLILLCKKALVSIDRIESKVFEKSRVKQDNGTIFVLVDYQHWGRDSHFVYYQLKKNFLQTFSDLFFIGCLIFYYNSKGFLISISILYIISFKLYFTFVKKEPFMKSLDVKYLRHYQVASVLHWGTLISSEIGLVTFRFNFLCAAILALNMLVIDIISNAEVLREKQKANTYFKIRNTLAVHALVYAYNEKSIVDNVRAFVKRSYFTREYNSNRVEETRAIEEPRVYFKDLSVFTGTGSYKTHLYKSLGVFFKMFMKANLWLRRKILETNSTSTNLLSLINNYLQKNA